MTKKVLLTALIAFCTITIVSAKAKIPVCIPCETIQTIQELPTDSEIQKLAGQKVNLSYLNNEYGILWMSIWNTKGRYVLSDISNNTYFEIDAQAAKILKEKHNFDVETAQSPLSFWKKAGGKLVFSIIVALLIWGSIPSKKKDGEVKPVNI
ncbi:hypothetical protein SAMN04487898_12925 [Pedobacter sp. ok626]|uniref:hypothetical protein n=1 Tax=Pedobacter sp. ok626 TaxID=1761882 RepID=UPI000883C1F5|nr:hypothetical protein [Pedobacter sp. ok626]SDL92726.1 hypothetical protein SAMN04487898_12925 [Pedobacter sp. ok626]